MIVKLCMHNLPLKWKISSFYGCEQLAGGPALKVIEGDKGSIIYVIYHRYATNKLFVPVKVCT